MKLGGAPGTLLAYGKAPDPVRCATKDSEYKVHSDSRFRDMCFFKVPYVRVIVL